MPAKTKKIWVGILLLFLLISAARAQHYVVGAADYMKSFLWYRGCSPTSASMVLNYWDNRGKSMGQYFGRLVDHWAENPDKVGWLGGEIPMYVINQLHEAMETNDEGETSDSMIHTGIQRVTNNYHGYNFQTEWIVSNPLPGSPGYDWCWNTIKSEIDSDRPFVWSVAQHDPTKVGHSLCAFGYTDSKYVITYNTWDSSENYWYYNQYDNGGTSPQTQVDKVIPGGGGNSDIMFCSPYPYQNIDGGKPCEIEWYQYGTTISKVNIFFTTYEEGDWQFIGSKSSSEGFNTFIWDVPNAQINSPRFRIEAFNSSETYIAGDGMRYTCKITCSSPFLPKYYYPSYPSADCDGNFTVSWDTISFASSYNLQRATDPDFQNRTTVYTGSATSWNQTALAAGTYYFRVAATNNCMSGLWTAYGTGGAIQVGGTGIPTDFNVPLGDCDGDITVSWSAVGDATSYELQGALDSAFHNAVTLYQGPNTYHRFTGVPSGYAYYLRVRAYSPCGGWGGWRTRGPIRVGTPPAPRSISYPTLSCIDNFAISWDYVREATSYELQRAPDSLFHSVTQLYSGPATTWYQTGLLSGTYYYRVRAISSCGPSAYRTGSMLTVTLYLGTPSEIRYPYALSGGTFAINWDPVNLASTYELRRRTSQSFDFPETTVYTGPSPSYEETGLAAGTYWYRVRAFNDCTTGSWLMGHGVTVQISGTAYLIPFGALNNGNINIGNLGGAAANVTCKLLDASGTPVKESTTTIPTLGVQRTWDLLGNIFSYGKPLTVEITADRPLAGDNIKWADPPYDTVGAGFTCSPLSMAKGTLFYFPFSAFGQSQGYAAISNTATSQANLTIEVYDQAGALKKTSAMTIGPRGVARTWEAVRSIQAIADPALIKIMADQEVVVEAVRWEQNKRGWGFAILPAVTGSGTSFLIPFGALNNGNINMANIGGAEANVTLRIWNASGQNIKEQAFTIPAKGVKRSWDVIGNIFAYGKPLTVEVLSDQALVGDNIKWANPPYDTVGAGFTCGPRNLMAGKVFYLPFSAFGQSQAYAVVSNTVASQANLTIEVYDQAGALKKTSGMTVGPKGVARTWEVIGSIQAIADPALIKIISDQLVVVEALRWEQNKRGWGFAVLPLAQ